MKSIILALAFCATIISTVMADGFHADISGDAIYGNGADTINTFGNFDLEIWVTASDSMTRVLWSTPFKIYANGDISSITTHNDSLGSSFAFLLDHGGEVLYENWDDNLADTGRIGIRALDLSGTGWDVWSTNLLFSFNISVTADTNLSGEFCVDSGNFIQTDFDWLFVAPELPWPESFCWPVKGRFVCGDANCDGLVDILDIVGIVNWLYYGPPVCNYQAFDVNGSCIVNILDITYTIAYLYQGGPEPNCVSCKSTPIEQLCK